MIEETFNHYSALALESEFFLGGLALGLIGIVVALLRTTYGKISGVVWKYIRASITIDNRAPEYRYVMLWLDQTKVLARARHLRKTDTAAAAGAAGFAPAPGLHWFWYQGRFATFHWQVDDRNKIGPAHNARPKEEVTLTVYFGGVSRLYAWIAAGQALAKRQDQKGPCLHVLKGDWWDRVAEVPRRGLASVLADDSRIHDLAADVKQFYASGDWYADRGVPWRRGYLLFGPPGTGKSSVIRAIASELDLDIATIDLGRGSLSDEDLREAMMSAPKGSLLTMEDIDALFDHRAKERLGGVSFSGLLNAIDGIGSQEGRALFMTTNHKERLDPALIRPGRADVHLELGWVTGNTAGQLFDRFFPGLADLRAEFVAQIGSAKVAPSAVQAWLLQHRDNSAAAAQSKGLLAPSGQPPLQAVG